MQKLMVVVSVAFAFALVSPAKTCIVEDESSSRERAAAAVAESVESISLFWRSFSESFAAGTPVFGLILLVR